MVQENINGNNNFKDVKDIIYEEHEITSLFEFESIIKEFNFNKMLFRGLTKNHRLTPKLFRKENPDKYEIQSYEINHSIKSRDCEIYEYLLRLMNNCLISYFSELNKKGRVSAGLGLFHETSQHLIPNKFLEYLNKYSQHICIAQHYGIPTIALDWTYDYKIALQFALKKCLNDDYAVVWIINRDILIENDNNLQNIHKLVFTDIIKSVNKNAHKQKAVTTKWIGNIEVDSENIDKWSLIDEIIKNILIECEQGDMCLKFNNKELNNESLPLICKIVIPPKNKCKIVGELYDQHGIIELYDEGSIENKIAKRMKKNKPMKKYKTMSKEALERSYINEK